MDPLTTQRYIIVGSTGGCYLEGVRVDFDPGTAPPYSGFSPVGFRVELGFGLDETRQEVQLQRAGMLYFGALLFFSKLNSELRLLVDFLLWDILLRCSVVPNRGFSRLQGFYTAVIESSDLRRKY